MRLLRRLRLWDSVLEPQAGREALAIRLAQAPKFSCSAPRRAAQGDAPVRRLSAPQLMAELLDGLRTGPAGAAP